ncbi:DNA-3-methyladenine glycosylase I [Pararhodobacter zhoushanensis]|uniref:DNA-3-methyladenine glycosylase I n=1 Tax=Pararhodobacter zhoushanensis TaxID=2479545 RepID=A0ABT3H4U7_9RHOB|nr:DNA-3-methyladenine glycosylase I [Pararhodobacter zhoushanensis]MCW1934829.1 DNA-3-methyladenine glycosylase I [Pararhodobacter zhoushanensis]
MHTEPGPDGQHRCWWCLSTPQYIAYHDDDWGYPVGEDQRLFEKLTLEAFQSGLSWRTILEKRDTFRLAFAGFDAQKVAGFDEGDVARLLQDKGIVRHRGKIDATINNARRLLELQASGTSFAAYVWGYEPSEAPTPGIASSPASVAMSKDLKKRGWKFVGPATVYAFMQAIGMVNDHLPTCAQHAKSEAARARFERPTA